MYSVAIIEDDEGQRALLARMVGESALSSRLAPMDAEATSSLDDLARQGADIALVDINLGSDAPSGIDLVRDAACARGVQVIYVTGDIDYVSDVYRTEHVAFLLKPPEQAKLDEALQRAVDNLDARRSDPFLVRSGGSLVRLAPESIVYIESDRRKARIHEGGRTVELYAKLSELAERLPGSFARCHKSFLVNLAFVKSVGASELVLTDGGTLPVSQRCRPGFLRAFALYVGRSI